MTTEDRECVEKVEQHLRRCLAQLRNARAVLLYLSHSQTTGHNTALTCAAAAAILGAVVDQGDNARLHLVELLGDDGMLLPFPGSNRQGGD